MSQYLSARKLIVSAALIGALTQQGPVLAASASALVEVDRAYTKSMTPTVELPGTVISTRDAEISAEVAARILWIAPVGAEVKQGESLATLDSELMALDMRRDEARIAQLRADIAVRERQRSRLASLASTNNMAASELDQVEGGIEMLRQDLAMAIVARERTALRLERAKVPAPFDGVVVSRSMSEGELTSIGSNLLRLVDTQALEIAVPAPLRVAQFNRSGTRVSIVSAGGDSVEYVRSLIPVADDQSRMMELRIAIENRDWMIGEAVSVKLPEANPSLNLTVPRDAIVLRDREQYIYTIDDNNQAKKVVVETTGGHGSRVSVRPISGELVDGAKVVVRGAESLRDGQDVRIAREGVVSLG